MPLQRRRTMVAAERVEVRPHVAMGPLDLVEEGRPRRAIRRGVARGERRDGRVLDLRGIAGGDAYPRAAGGGQGREADDVVLDDDLGPELVDDLAQPAVDVLRAVDERLPGRLDELAELLDGRLAKDGRGVP